MGKQLAQIIKKLIDRFTVVNASYYISKKGGSVDDLDVVACFSQGIAGNGKIVGYHRFMILNFTDDCHNLGFLIMTAAGFVTYSNCGQKVA